jgi:hypothetical protein
MWIQFQIFQFSETISGKTKNPPLPYFWIAESGPRLDSQTSLRNKVLASDRRRGSVFHRGSRVPHKTFPQGFPSSRITGKPEIIPVHKPAWRKWGPAGPRDSDQLPSCRQLTRNVRRPNGTSTRSIFASKRRTLEVKGGETIATFRSLLSKIRNRIHSPWRRNAIRTRPTAF